MNFESAQKKRLLLYNEFLNLKIGNETLEEIFIFDGVSYLNVAGPEFILYSFIEPSIETSGYILKLKHQVNNILILIKNLFYRKNNFLNIKQTESIYLSFVDYMSVETLFPISRYLNDKTCLYLLDSNNDKNLYIKQGIKHIDYHNFIDFTLCFNFIKKKYILRNKCKQVLNSSEIKNFISENKNYLDKNFFLRLSFFLKNRLESILIMHLSFNNVISNLTNLKICITCDVADPRTRIFSELLKQIKKPCLLIQFGTLSNLSIEWFYFNFTKVAVWGKKSRDNLTNMNLNTNDIIVTGTPRYNTIDSKMTLKANRKYSKLNVLFAPPHGLFDFASVYEMYKITLSTIANINNIQLYIKPHPLSSEEDLKILNEYNFTYILLDKYDNVSSLINKCDIFINAGSTLTIDAVIAKKYIICFNNSNWNYYVKEFLGYNIINMVSNSNELHQAIDQYNIENVNSDEYQYCRYQFLKEWINYTNECPIQNISKLINTLINDSN